MDPDICQSLYEFALSHICDRHQNSDEICNGPESADCNGARQAIGRALFEGLPPSDTDISGKEE